MNVAIKAKTHFVRHNDTAVKYFRVSVLEDITIPAGSEMVFNPRNLETMVIHPKSELSPVFPYKDE